MVRLIASIQCFTYVLSPAQHAAIVIHLSPGRSPGVGLISFSKFMRFPCGPMTQFNKCDRSYTAERGTRIRLSHSVHLAHFVLGSKQNLTNLMNLIPGSGQKI